MYSLEDHLQGCQSDEEFKVEAERELDNVGSTKDERAEEFLNYDIRVEEIEAVFQQLRKNKAPGYLQWVQK